MAEEWEGTERVTPVTYSIHFFSRSSIMTSVVDTVLVKQEYDRLAPLYQCRNCSRQGQEKSIEDHIVKRHLVGDAPFRCKECSATFARRDTARGHNTRQHPGKVFPDAVECCPEARATLLSKYARVMTREEGLAYCHDRLALQQRKACSKATSQSQSQPQPPKEVSPPTPPPTTSASSSTPISLHAPQEDPLLATPPVLLTPLQSTAQTPELPRQNDFADLELMFSARPAVPTMLDVMSMLQGIAAKQDRLQAQVTSLQSSVRRIEEDNQKIKSDVTRCGQTASAAQGEARRCSNNMTKVITGINKVTAGIDRIGDYMRHVSKHETDRETHTKAALREIIGGCQRGLDAMEDRPSKCHAARNDEGRTQREESAKRSLEL